MRKPTIVLLCLCLCAQIPADAQRRKGGKKGAKTAKSADKKSEKVHSPQFRFRDGDTHDFGKVPSGKDVTYEFVFTNTGNSPLIIQDVKSPYGTTTPEWTRHPVSPGGRGTITVGYTTHKKGPFSREIYVESNASANTAEKHYTLHIRGTVD